MHPRESRRQSAALAAGALATVLVAAVVGLGWPGAARAGLSAPEGFVQPRDAEGRFQNLDRRDLPGFGAFLRWQWNRLLGRTTHAPRRAPVPRVEPDWAKLQRPPGPGEGARLTWVGHATWLVQLDGRSFLLDPVLSDSIPGFIDRNVPPGVPFERLPRIDAALVSHNHYDHLDLPTLARLGAPVVAGLGTGKLLRKQKLVVTELGWWQATAVGDVKITFVPAQHFSQRGLSDRNQALWGGFVLEGSAATVYHSGDTAFFEGFAQIGQRFHIDAALLAIGAYDPAWFMDAVHLSPERALQAFGDLRAETFLGMHWGTFKLSDEPLDEPPRRLEAERHRRGLPPERVRVLAIGETLEVRKVTVQAADSPGAAPSGTPPTETPSSEPQLPGTPSAEMLPGVPIPP